MRYTLIGRHSETNLLAHVRLTETERRAAEHYLALGERVADTIIDTATALSAALHAMERAIRTLSGTRSTS